MSRNARVETGKTERNFIGIVSGSIAMIVTLRGIHVDDGNVLSRRKLDSKDRSTIFSGQVSLYRVKYVELNVFYISSNTQNTEK